MNVEHFAMMYGLIAREAIGRFGAEGEEAVREGVRQYGSAYGRRVAGRAGADGRPNDFVSYAVYGEFDFSETGNVMEIEQRAPHVVIAFSKCGWCEAWKRGGLQEMGRIYCEEIDRAILQAFNPGLQFRTESTLTGGAERCRLIYEGCELSDDALLRLLSEKERVGTSALRPFDGRVVEMYRIMRDILSRRFGQAGREAIDSALAAFGDLYGPGAVSQVISTAGWSEGEIRNRDLMAPCGLYCGVCGVYIATRDKNEKFRAAMGKLYGTKPEDTVCLGCMQKDPPAKLYAWCKSCKIRDCVRSRNFQSCHQCGDWPCEQIRGFGLATGRRVMQQTIPIWREKAAALGNEEGSVEWARSVCERYHCPDCGYPLFRGAQRCRGCGAPVAERLDGSL